MPSTWKEQTNYSSQKRPASLGIVETEPQSPTWPTNHGVFSFIQFVQVHLNLDAKKTLQGHVLKDTICIHVHFITMLQFHEAIGFPKIPYPSLFPKKSIMLESNKNVPRKSSQHVAFCVQWHQILIQFLVSRSQICNVPGDMKDIGMNEWMMITEAWPCLVNEWLSGWCFPWSLKHDPGQVTRLQPRQDSPGRPTLAQLQVLSTALLFSNLFLLLYPTLSIYLSICVHSYVYI